MRRKPLPAKPDPRPEWMVQQGNRCGCKGTDDMCPCQNEDQSQPQSRRDLAGEVRTLELQQQTDRQTIAGLLRARETAEARATAAEALLREAGEVVEVFTGHYSPWMDSFPDNDQSSTFSRHTYGQLRAARALAAKLKARAALTTEGR